MNQGSWGFVAGMVVMGALGVVEICVLTPRVYTGAKYDARVAVELRDC